jgi:hypothetical protein
MDLAENLLVIEMGGYDECKRGLCR